jgi:hypothetical protein
MANTDVFGIDPDRRMDESFVNKFDLKHKDHLIN